MNSIKTIGKASFGRRPVIATKWIGHGHTDASDLQGKRFDGGAGTGGCRVNVDS